jgi:hypothetical protein
MSADEQFARGAETGRGGWSYDEAFARHRGLLSADDPDRLRRTKVRSAEWGRQRQYSAERPIIQTARRSAIKIPRA